MTLSDPSRSDPHSPSIAVDFGQLLPWLCLLNLPPPPQSPDQLPSHLTETKVSKLCPRRINPPKTNEALGVGHHKSDQPSSR